MKTDCDRRNNLLEVRKRRRLAYRPPIKFFTSRDTEERRGNLYSSVVRTLTYCITKAVRVKHFDILERNWNISREAACRVSAWLQLEKQVRDKFTVGLIQMSCGPEPADNLAKALDRVAEAARKGADVVCLPELFQTQYFCQREDAALFDLAEPIPGTGTEKLAAAARQNKVVLIASLFEKRAPGLYHNTVAVFDSGGDSDGALVGIYRKMHIPDDPLYYEKYYFTPGDLGFKAFGTSAGKLGTLVCWDQWYPEGARLTALQGASILFYPTAIGWHPAEKAEFGEAQNDAWRTIQRAHAIANGVYVGVVNRVGLETGNIRGNSVPGKGLEFWGGSFFCDPFGRVLAEASHDKEEILLGEVDLHQLEEIRRNWPFLRDRRIDSYAPITSRMIDDK